ncbi:alkaline phosphatase [Carboxylicivirga sediminis]|uniref:Alkaline phosphatase n=1 Tax=Carboxylicivirga sediminis TaxID=2006564 RepID=A0A941F4L3_9BACT|nr:alkaline phosphatase [Carboxylicivirga sediminis]MBR8536347.1 alkaline phosphatase [Carboxylicivirga sediminis]
MRNFRTAFVALLVLACFTANAQEDYKDLHAKYEYTIENTHEVLTINYDDIRFKKRPKNIILFIGDGMGVSQVFAGITANNGLNMELMPYIGFSKTQSADNYVTDSAAGGTALSTGTRTYNGAIGVDVNGENLTTILEYSERNGKATGLVSTSAITHATPASFIAHQPKRSMYEEIAADFLNTDIDVFIGGGGDFFTKRTDGRNLVLELNQKGYRVGYNVEEVDNFTSGKLAVLTAVGHNAGYRDRGEMLTKSTAKAIEVLDNADSKGFFLMVEGSQIDWGGHQNDASYVTGEVLDMDKALAEALKFAMEDRRTLVIVTADHETGGMSVLNGDPNKGHVKTGFTTGDHSPVMVPVFAFGAGAEQFSGVYNNTEIFEKMYKLFKFKEADKD